MPVYLVLRHPDAEQVWANAWIPGTDLVEAITTDQTVAGRCTEAQRSSEFIYVHRCAFAGSPASVVSKAKVSNVAKIDSTTYFVSFTDQQSVSAPPPRDAEQGDRSYLAPAVA